MTARPSGAFWLGSIAIGTMPMIIASAVISTGRTECCPPQLQPSLRRHPPSDAPGEADYQDAIGGGDAHAHDRAGKGWD